MAEIDDGAARFPANEAAFVFDDHPEIFEAFDKESNQKSEEINGIIEGIENYPTLVTKIKDKSQPLRLLLIGPGGGKVEVPVLSHIASVRGRQDNIRVEGIDPSSQAHRQFASHLDNQGLDQIDLQWHSDGFEKFNSQEAYDLILAVQSFQYVGDWKGQPAINSDNNSFKKIKRLAGEKGLGAIVIQSREGDVNLARELFHVTSVMTTGKPKGSEPSSERIAEEMAFIGIKGTYSRKNWQLEVSSFFPNHTGPFRSREEIEAHFRPDENGKRLLSFLIRESWDETTPEFKNAFAHYFIPNFGYSFTRTNSEGRQVWDGVDDFIWITNLEPNVEQQNTAWLVPGDEGDLMRDALGLKSLHDE